jgi:hypothetical protein
LEERYGSASYRGAPVAPVNITDALTGETITTPFPERGTDVPLQGIDVERKKDLQRAKSESSLLNEEIVFFSTGGNEDLQQYVSKLCYNEPVAMNGGHLFSMLDAAGLSWSKREFSTPGDTNRPQDLELGSQDRQHYWSRTLLESFVASRERHINENETDMPWEVAVRLAPDKCFRSSMIGSLSERTWKEQFPLLNSNHALRGKLERMRSLDVLWYALKHNTSKLLIRSNLPLRA